MTFEKFNFSQRQVKAYFTNAEKNLKIAREADVPEVIFHFSYDALIRLAISVCAFEGLRVLSRSGHHAELINKLSSILQDRDIRSFGNEMRKKRNMDIYGTGVLISRKEAESFLEISNRSFVKAGDFINKKSGKDGLF